MARQTRTIRPKKVSREEIRAGLDPMFYADIETFRKAVADGSIDREKGCRECHIGGAKSDWILV